MHAPRCSAALVVASVLGAAACGPPPAAMTTDIGTATAHEGFVRTEAAPPALIAMPLGVDVDAVWRVLPGVFASMEIPVGVIDARSRIIGQNRIVMSSIDGRAIRTYFRCAFGGAGPSAAASYRISFDLAAQPRRSGNGTELMVQTMASASSIDSSRSGTLSCTSTGELEKLLESRLKTALGA